MPYVLIYYIPETSNPNLNMSYAAAVALMGATAQTNRVIEIKTAEELEEIEKLLGG